MTEPATRPVLTGELIHQVRAETCGNCRYAKPIQLGTIECWGLPGTPVVLGGKPNIAGQVEIQIEIMRPRCPTAQARCALWAEKDLASSIAEGRA